MVMTPYPERLTEQVIKHGGLEEPLKVRFKPSRGTVYQGFYTYSSFLVPIIRSHFINTCRR
jgi:hypothetical protein